jgi:hypothetical protein
MSRTLTKSQPSVIVRPRQKQRQTESLPQLLTDGVVLGAVVGSGIATCILLTDMFGLFTLARAQSDPIATIVGFIASGIMIFTPLCLAVAVGLAGRKS